MEKGGTHSLCKVFPTPPPEAGGNGIISQTFVLRTEKLCLKLCPVYTGPLPPKARQEWMVFGD